MSGYYESALDRHDRMFDSPDYPGFEESALSIEELLFGLDTHPDYISVSVVNFEDADEDEPLEAA